MPDPISMLSFGVFVGLLLGTGTLTAFAKGDRAEFLSMLGASLFVLISTGVVGAVRESRRRRRVKRDN